MGRGSGGGWMVRVRALDFASVDGRAGGGQLALRIGRAAVSAHWRDAVRRLHAGDADSAGRLRRGVGACVRRELGVAGNLGGRAGGAVRSDVSCARDQMRRAAMAGARGDRTADLQSVLHVPELFVHDGDSVPDGDDRGASRVRQGGRDGASSCGCGWRRRRR